MTHSNKRNSFLHIAGAACQVSLTLKSGFTVCCPVQLDVAEPEVDQQVLELNWGVQDRCIAVISEQGIDEGNWANRWYSSSSR